MTSLDRRQAWEEELERARDRLREPRTPAKLQEHRATHGAGRESTRTHDTPAPAEELDPAALARQVNRYPWERTTGGESTLPPRPKR